MLAALVRLLVILPVVRLPDPRNDVCSDKANDLGSRGSPRTFIRGLAVRHAVVPFIRAFPIPLYHPIIIPLHIGGTFAKLIPDPPGPPAR